MTKLDRRKPALSPRAPGLQIEMSLAVGDLCRAWGSLELELFHVFSDLSDAPVAVSRAIFYELNATRTRSEMLKAVAIVVLGKGDDFDALDTLLAKINKSARRRNSYVHDPWMSPVKDDLGMMQMRLSGDNADGEIEEVEAKDVYQLYSQVRTWRLKMEEWSASVRPKLPSLHEKLRQKQTLSLEPRLKGSRRTPPAKS